MITLTVIILQVWQGANFFHILIVAMIIDLILSLYVFFLFEKQKKALNGKFTSMVNNFRSEQERLEEIIEQFENAQSDEENKKGLLGFQLKEHQELKEKLEKNLKTQNEQKAEIEDYKTKANDYLKKIRHQEKIIEGFKTSMNVSESIEENAAKKETGSKEDPLISKLQPVPQEIKM